jgi:hypothetical protein
MLDLAMQWEVVPDKFFLNLGSGIRFFQSVFYTRDRIRNFEGEEVEGSREVLVRNTFSPAETSMYLGITFRPTVNMELQAVLGVDMNNSVNVFLPDRLRGLFGFSNIMATWKF